MMLEIGAMLEGVSTLVIVVEVECCPMLRKTSSIVLTVNEIGNTCETCWDLCSQNSSVYSAEIERTGKVISHQEASFSKSERNISDAISMLS